MSAPEHFATVAHRWLGTLRPVAGLDLPAPVAASRPVIASPVTRPEESTVTSTNATTTSTPVEVLTIIAAIRRVDDGPDRDAWALAEAITEDLEAIGVDADIDRVTKLIESVSGWDEIGADELADKLSEAVAR